MKRILAGFFMVLLLVAFVTGCSTDSDGAPQGPDPVDIGAAGNYVILAKSAITTTGATAIVGDLGISPAALSDTEGFSPALDGSGTFATSTYVTGGGRIYAAGMTDPTPANLGAAVLDMQAAYTNAAGRTLPDAINLGAGNIGGLTITPGLYKWTSGVSIPFGTNVTLEGDGNDVWIFQIAGDFTQASATQVILSGGANPENIFWQTFGVASIGTTAHFEGIILSYTNISLDTGATLNGRLLSQTAVTLDANAVSQP